MKLRNFLYPVKVRRSGQTFLVKFPDLPEALTEGATREEAMENAFDCLEEAVASRIAGHEDIPKPGFLKDGFAPAVALSALMSAKAALYLARREAGLSNVQLAKRLGLDERQVRVVVKRANQVAVGAVRADETGDRDHPRLGKEFRDFADSANVLRPILSGESKVLVQSVANVIAVEAIGMLAAIEQDFFERDGHG